MCYLSIVYSTGTTFHRQLNVDVDSVTPAAGQLTTPVAVLMVQ